jgi:small subunit ribosomal protein S4e
MGFNHLKRHSAPKSWPIKRKNITFIAKPNAGSHNMKYVIPVVVLFRDVLNYAETSKEVKKIVNAEEILVNGKVVKDIRFPVGIFDVLEIKSTEEKFVLVLDSFGKFKLVEEKSNTMYLKLSSKTKIKGGKLQFGFMNGFTLFVDEKTFNTAKVNDTIVYDFVKKSIESIVNLKAGVYVYFFDGNYVGKLGKINSIEKKSGITSDIVEVEINGDIHTTIKKYAFAISSKKTDLKRFE